LRAADALAMEEKERGHEEGSTIGGQLKVKCLPSGAGGERERAYSKTWAVLKGGQERNPKRTGTLKRGTKRREKKRGGSFNEKGTDERLKK